MLNTLTAIRKHPTKGFEHLSSVLKMYITAAYIYNKQLSHIGLTS